jgi:hypothetical protein
MWPCLDIPDNPEDAAGMENHGADALYSAVKSVMSATRSEYENTQQDSAHRTMEIANSWRVRRLSQLKQANRSPLVWIQKYKTHPDDPWWIGDAQATQKTPAKRYASHSASAPWGVYQWGLVYFLVVLRDTEDCKEVYVQGYNELPLDQ